MFLSIVIQVVILNLFFQTMLKSQSHYEYIQSVYEKDKTDFIKVFFSLEIFKYPFLLLPYVRKLENNTEIQDGLFEKVKRRNFYLQCSYIIMMILIIGGVIFILFFPNSTRG